MSRIADMRSFTENLNRSHEERRANFAARQAEVKSQIEETCVDRQKAAEALCAELSEGRADLFQRVNDMMGEIHHNRMTMAIQQRETLAQDRTRLRVETANFLGDACDARQEMAKARREALEAEHMALQADVSTTLEGFRVARKELADSLAEFSQVWQSFASEMQARRAGVIPSPPSAAEKVEPAPPPSVGAKRTSETGGVPTGEAVFDYLADHPDGARLTDLEAFFGTPRIRLVPIVQRLIQGNKASKDDERKLYFAA